MTQALPGDGEYRILDGNPVLSLAAPFLPGAPGPLVAEEIGDGNVNLVFRVRAGNGSVIVKPALPYLRIVGASWPLTLERARIEADALALQERLAPGSVPAAIAHRTLGDARYARWVDGCAVQLWTAFVDEASRLWPAHEPWRERFLGELLAESARFAGAVMCRRTVGLAGVSDIRDIADDGPRLRAQRASLVGGVALLRSQRVASVEALWALAAGAA